MQGAILAAPTGGFAFKLDAARFFGDAPPDDAALTAGLADDPARRQAATLPYLAYAGRLAALEAALRANGQWAFPHPWLMTFVGDHEVEAVAGEDLRRLDPVTDLGPFGQVVLSPLRTAAMRSPMLRLPTGDLSFTLNLVRIPATPDAANARRLVQANRAAYDRIRAAGGTLYPVSALAMSRGDWRAHFGPAFDRLAAAKRRYDPRHVLTPGYEVF